MKGETITSIVNMPLGNILAFGMIVLLIGAVLIFAIKTLRKYGLASVGPVKFEEKIKESQREIFTRTKQKT
jgi:hypothetical protein